MKAYKHHQILKNSFTVLAFLLLAPVLLAQNKLSEADWVAILSGKVESYKMHHIKSIKLLKNTEVLKSLNYDATNNILQLTDNKEAITYYFDEKQRPFKISFPNRVHTFSYSETNPSIISYSIALDSDSIFQTQSIKFPYKENPKISWFELQKQNKSDNKIAYFYSQKKVLNAKDSLWGYYETRTNKNYYRRYFNGALAKLKYTSDTRYTYDSIYYLAHREQYSQYDRVINDSIERRIYTNDSTFCFYLKANKVYHRIVKDKVDFHKEYFYDANEKLVETVVYTYYPFKKTGNLFLWKKTHYNPTTNQTKIEYPYNHCFKLKNNAVVRRKKWLFGRKCKSTTQSFGCGTTFRVIKLPYYTVDRATTSILIDLNMVYNYLDTEEISDELSADDLTQWYIHTEITLNDPSAISFSGLFTTEKIPYYLKREIRILGINLTRKKENYKEYHVELTTNDGVKWTCNAYDYFDKIQPNIDFLIYPEYVEEPQSY